MNRLTRNHALAFMVLCLLVAAALRLPNLPAAPPGLHYDEAANGILAADIGLRGDRPVFISSYTGKEVLFFYLAGGMMRLLGDSVFSLRLTAAFVGLLTVAATYWLGREMLADRRLAILAAALLAVSFWHVLFSRLGFRAVTQPLLQAITVAALFRGLRRQGHERWFVAAGFFLGLTAYTYLAARLFPLLLLLGLAPLLLTRETFHSRWRQIALFVAVAFITLLPLLVYFTSHPDAFWVRIGQVSPGSSSANLTLWDSLLKSWGMLFLRGDPFWRFNLPGRPLFNWIIGGLLILGWVVILIRRRRFPYDWQRAAINLLIFTPLVMILPTALATNEIVPSNLRAMGLIPFIFFLPPIGFIFLFRDIDRRFGYPPLTFAVIFGALLVLLSGGIATEKAYFEDWAKEPILFFESDGDLTAVAGYLDEIDLSGKTLYVAAPHYRHPTVAFLSDQYENVKWLPGGDALVLPPEGQALIVYPHNSPAPAWADPYLESGEHLDVENGGSRTAVFEAYEIPELSSFPVPENAGANFGHIITLLGYETNAAKAGSELPITLFWRVDALPTANFMPFLQLEDAWGKRWSQKETFSYPAEQWAVGDKIIQQVALPIPLGTPPGNYRVRVGLFDPDTETRLPLLDQNSSYAGDSYFIENVTVNAGDMVDALPNPPFALNKQILADLQLAGLGRGGPTAAAGTPYELALWWLANEPLPNINLVFELIDSGGNTHTLSEGQPVHDSYPFEDWQTPQFVIDQQTIKIPADFEAGDYKLSLRVLAAAGTLAQIDLGPLKVESPARLFEPPELDHEVNASFGNEIALLGYNLRPAGDNEYELLLVWQASGSPQRDYTVFTHLLDQNGACCIWQADMMPQNNQYPTSQWLAGEVVLDPYNIMLPPDLPAGEYPLEIGLYIGETGQRLLIEIPGEEGRDALHLQPIVIP
jgi:4-amino-4-deoxy-L-arabinose transferase-like glycosyltransferase